MKQVEEIIKEGEKILRMTRPAVRHKSWRIWQGRVQSLLREGQVGSDVPIHLKVDTLAADLRALNDYARRTLTDDNSSISPPNPDLEEDADTSTAPSPTQRNAEFNVFISHRAAHDQEIANTIRDKLRILSNGTVESFMYEKIRGGEDWHEWVEKNILKSNLLLLLYTDNEMDLRWCLYEAGLFRGARNKYKHLVCLKNCNISASPKPLQRFQAYNGDRDGLNKFLVDLLYRGSFTDGRKLSPDLWTDYKDEFDKAIRDIEYLFQERQLHKNYFRKRLEILIDDKEKTAKYPNGRYTSSDESSYLDEIFTARIEAGELTRDLLGLSDGELEWGNVYTQLNIKGHQWVDEISDVIRAVRTNEPIRQVLTSFECGSSRICLPLVSRVEHVKRQPRLLSVIFVETENAERARSSKECLTRAPQPLMTIVQLLNLARQFRWNILEHFIAKLGHPDTQGAVLSDLLADLNESLTRLENEADTFGYLQLDSIAQSLPDVSRETIAGMFEDFYAERAELKDAIANTGREEVLASLRKMRFVNKRFLLIALAEYTKRIASLEPEEIATIEDALK